SQLVQSAMNSLSCELRPEMYTEATREPYQLELNWVVNNDPTAPVNPVGLDQEIGSTLLGAVPNPLISSTKIGIFTASNAEAYLSVIDLTGRRMTGGKLQLAAGENYIRVDALDWPAGIYTYTVEINGEWLSGKIVKK
ncbi:MAG: T9SS type A sorting domain-containing protein, partial [Bacteroidota bacterium]